MSERYRASEEFLQRAEKTIPLGSQTFSKSKTQYPLGISPLFADRAKNANLWDIDGNKFIDMVSSLASVTLGHNDRGTRRAVSKQLSIGSIMSLPGRLESEVAELISELVPSAEMVRFGKNGTDATSAAVRLARAYTGRDHVAVCGYHGWQDWSIGTTTRNKGVPQDVIGLSHVFQYNDLSDLERLLECKGGQIAAIVMEPMNFAWPHEGYLEGVRRLATEYGCVLIFDETITGFRYSAGGAQELFKVRPDLSTFGKGIANGYPLSAVAGRREIMLEMENIFFSGTFGGELLSLAAAKHVLQRHAHEDICGTLANIGKNLATALEEIIKRNELGEVLTLSGHSSWKFLHWKENSGFKVEQIRTFFMQEMFLSGVLVLGTHNVTLAHNGKIQRRLLSVYDSVLAELAKALREENLDKKLKVKPLAPLFKVR